MICRLIIAFERCMFGFLPRDLYLNFQCQTFQVGILTSIGWKMQTLLLVSDRKSGICHWMVPLGMLYIITLTYIFKVTNFDMWISRKRWKLAESGHVRRLWRLKFAIEGTIANGVRRDLDLHFQVQTCSCYAFSTKKNCSGSGCPRQICLESHHIHWGIALDFIAKCLSLVAGTILNSLKG